MLNDSYLKQAKLVIQLLPYVMKHECFALKGGTAINFFLRNLPRLSIDIDLAYIPIEDRKTTIHKINDSLKDISTSVKKVMRNVRISPKVLHESSLWRGIIIENEGILVKVEPNPIIRGTVYPCEIRDLLKDAENLFETFVSVQTLSLPDLYGGKICAALDRQHPRDLFDIKLLLENEGFNEGIRKAFIVYLISHNRPIHELLDPGIIDSRDVFEKEFSGMTRIDVKYEDLVKTREELLSTIKNELTDDEKKFLLSLKRREPEWELIGLEGIDKLPAVRWKLMNLEKMPREKHHQAVKNLEEVLGL